MTTQVAARGAKEVIPKVLPPSSPFSELLRRSKFATFDPCIRQTYSAPPSYAQRGNYGLKRPISNRKSHGYIVLKKYEEHAQYIEWDNAKEQVRWIKRVEELNITPLLKKHSTWAYGLGPLGTSKESGLDSDFCPGEDSLLKMKKTPVKSDEEAEIELESRRTKDVAVEAIDAFPATEESRPHDLPLSTPEPRISAEKLLPTRGKGAYGAKADVFASDTLGKMFLQPNISGMPPAVFKRYKEKLRQLRPEFIAFVRKELKKIWMNNKATNIDPDPIPDEELVAVFSSSLLFHKFHLCFLGIKSEAEYHSESAPDLSTKDRAKLEREVLKFANKPQPIRPQPHKFAGLMYAQPTALESRFTSKPQPGVYLQQTPGQTFSAEKHIASFAGMTAHLRHLGVGANPVFESSGGANLDNIPQSTRLMTPQSLQLQQVPIVVGRAAPSKPLIQVQMRVAVADDAGLNRNHTDNPHTPGSYEYNSLRPVTGRMRPSGLMIPNRAHGRDHPWAGAAGGIMYDSKTKSWRSSRSGHFDPKSTTPQFRRLNFEKEVQESDDVTRSVVGSMLKRVGRRKPEAGGAGESESGS